MGTDRHEDPRELIMKSGDKGTWLHAELPESERTPLVPKKKWFTEHGKDLKKQESPMSRNTRGRHAFLLVYDVTDQQSWEEVKRLVQLIQKRMYKSPVPILIVGTKTDLGKPGKRFMTPDETFRACKTLLSNQAKGIDNGLYM